MSTENIDDMKGKTIEAIFHDIDELTLYFTDGWAVRITVKLDEVPTLEVHEWWVGE